MVAMSAAAAASAAVFAGTIPAAAFVRVRSVASAGGCRKNRINSGKCSVTAAFTMGWRLIGGGGLGKNLDNFAAGSTLVLVDRHMRDVLITKP
jgi:hypothetical protein